MQVTAEVSGATAQLVERMAQQFSQRFSDRPMYRFVAVPQNVDQELDFSDPQLKEHFLHPPQTRPSGFTFWDVAEFTPSADEWVGTSVGEHTYILTREGYFEFNYPVDGDSVFQWLHHKYPSTPPWLYPLAVCEMAVSCCRFVAGLVASFGLCPQLLVKHEYFAIQGYWLPPRRPELLWARDLAETRYPKPNIQMKFRNYDFSVVDPDHVARDLVRYAYSSFGLTADDVPYFDEDGHFVV